MFLVQFQRQTKVNRCFECQIWLEMTKYVWKLKSMKFVGSDEVIIVVSETIIYVPKLLKAWGKSNFFYFVTKLCRLFCYLSQDHVCRYMLHCFWETVYKKCRMCKYRIPMWWRIWASCFYESRYERQKKWRHYLRLVNNLYWLDTTKNKPNYFVH